MNHIVETALIVCVVLFSVWILGLYILQDVLIFPRHRAKDRIGDLEREGVEVLWHETSEGKVPAWFLRGRDSHTPGGCGVVVLLHGNGNVIDDYLELAQDIARLGPSVLLPEYRGYGHAQGRPSQRKLVEDVVGFITQVERRSDVKAKNTVVYGRSIGSAVAAQVALRVDLKGMILHTAPTSIACYSWRYGAPPFLIRHPFRTDHALAKLKSIPILMIPHHEDALVPMHHSHALKDIAPHAQVVELHGGHSTFRTREDRAGFKEAVSVFITENLVDPTR